MRPSVLVPFDAEIHVASSRKGNRERRIHEQAGTADNTDHQFVGSEGANDARASGAQLDAQAVDCESRVLTSDVRCEDAEPRRVDLTTQRRNQRVQAAIARIAAALPPIS